MRSALSSGDYRASKFLSGGQLPRDTPYWGSKGHASEIVTAPFTKSFLIKMRHENSCGSKSGGSFSKQRCVTGQESQRVAVSCSQRCTFERRIRLRPPGSCDAPAATWEVLWTTRSNGPRGTARRDDSSRLSEGCWPGVRST